MTHILNASPTRPSATFMRKDGHHLHLGVIVAYVLVGVPFEIVISRESIRVQGTFPPCPPQGIRALQQMLTRAVRHHEHLKGYAEGDKQMALDERILEAEEVASSMIAKSPTVQ